MQKLMGNINCSENSIVKQFKHCVQNKPHKIAVILPNQNGQGLNYEELDQQSDILASQLIKEGVSSGDLVGLYVERSVEMVIAMLAILKARAAYVPLDPSYPKERLQFMLDDIQAPVILTQTSLSNDLSVDYAKVICIDEVNFTEIGSAVDISQGSLLDLAYVIYTSGSTGNPKGVMVVHQGVIRLVKEANYVNIDEISVFLQLAATSFDAATFEIWGALLNGATLVLYPASGIPDPELLSDIIEKYQVTTLWLTASLFNSIIDEKPETLFPIKELLTGGEALSVPHICKAQKLLPHTQLINGYGPTENTTFTCCYSIPTNFDSTHQSVPIGKAIHQTTTIIVDPSLKPVVKGEEGELLTGGAGVAIGYLNRVDLTEKAFIEVALEEGFFYRTGDRVRERSDGNIEFIGRIDSQVKINGYRVELGEIDVKIKQQLSVKDAVVVVHQKGGFKQLVAYVVFVERDENSVQTIKEALKQLLPDYMQPTFWHSLDKIPLTANGKLDRNNLPIVTALGVNQTTSYSAAKNQQQQTLVEIWAAILEIEKLGIDDNVFDLGATSIMCLRFVARVKKALDLHIPIDKVFQYPSVRTLLESLNGKVKPLEISAQKKMSQSDTAIAIIGMAGRFPGADNVDEFWKNICEGKESITLFTKQELQGLVSGDLLKDPNYVKARGVINNVEQFDAAFFGISPREAEIMDPQQRICLELAWEALENSGYASGSDYEGKVGVYAGMNNNTYYDKNVRSHTDKVAQYGEFNAMLANEKDFLTTRVSYKLNLTGPSVNVYTACSTSLTAVAYAFDALLDGQCDLALAGGVSVIVPQKSGYLYQEGGMLSPDGHCRPFDADAKGTTFNSGAGLVVLKREKDAIADGDTIYAVIRGVGISNDGGEKASFTAPSGEGQAVAIQSALNRAGFEAETLSYIETHGTGTPLGDPIEVAGLNRVFGSGSNESAKIAIGSVKGNVGHLVHAAGVAGLIKTALSLKNKVLPATLHYKKPNPNIDFSQTPFYVNNQLIDWQQDEGLRRAGVSSFGVGGTNVHLVLEESLTEETPLAQPRSKHLLLMSARNESSLEQMAKDLSQSVQCHPEINLADIAYTLQTGRKVFNYRRALVCNSREDAIQTLIDFKQSTCRKSLTDVSPVVFMFPGQGSQYLGMGRDLYHSEPVFHDVIDECITILKPKLDLNLRDLLFETGNIVDPDTLLKQTKYTQPALFIIEYALAKLWQSWGVKPEAMIGHSIGEFVAACLSGVFSLKDGLSLVVARASMMQRMPAGNMLSVRMPAKELRVYLTDDISLAAVNSPFACVVSGLNESIETLQTKLDSEGVATRVLQTSHAFHSAMMEPVVAPFLVQCKNIVLSPPKIPFVSTVTADWITPEQATDPLYWATHLRETVQFSAGIQTLWERPERLLLEVGPRTTTATLARQQAKDKRQQIALSSLTNNADNHNELKALLDTVGQLWAIGVKINGQNFYPANQKYHRVPLPTYPFERKRHWLEAKLIPQESVVDAQSSLALTAIQHNITQQIGETEMSATGLNYRTEQLTTRIKEVLEEMSGIIVDDDELTFMELGFDSLILTQASLALKNEFLVDITFRQLLEDFTTPKELVIYLDNVLPEESFTFEKVDSLAVEVSQPVINTSVPLPINTGALISGEGEAGAGIAQVMLSQQLQLISQQLVQLAGGQPQVKTASSVETPSKPLSTQKTEIKPVKLQLVSEKGKAKSSMPSRGVKIQHHSTEILTDNQRTALDDLIKRYNIKTAKSKAMAQDNRKHLSDPRTVSGFTPLLKELIYPIVTNKAEGSKLWDIDGNKYVDLTCGFGLNFFGWSPKFVTDAVIKQLKLGIEIGPQTPLAGKVAKQICEMTGNERVAFSNTGSEAVLAAIRLARTVTGRSLIVMFSGGYHGIFDEVVVRGSDSLRSFPAAPGIPSSMVENILVLDYGTAETMEILESRADEFAAILVETVQSRRPDLQPKEFLIQLRALTERSGSALIFDEVVTGFRIHPGGAQAYFGIKADLATYGKVLGGGFSIGVVAGKAKYMDALDGGQWQYGDDSIPEVGVTFFAGTFVRQPLALAAAEAVLNHLKDSGPKLQEGMNQKVERFVTSINQFFKEEETPYQLTYFSSFFYLPVPTDLPYTDLIFYYLRERGIHIWESRPLFFTTAHTEEDIEKVAQAFKDSIHAMQQAEFLPLPDRTVKGHLFNHNEPPVSGARLGKNAEGNPAWFVEDQDRKGKYREVKI